MNVLQRVAAVVGVGTLALAGVGVVSALGAGAGSPVPALDATVDPNPVTPGDEAEAFPTSEEDWCFAEVKPAVLAPAGFNPENYEVVWGVARSDDPGNVIDEDVTEMNFQGDWTADLTTDDYQPGEHLFSASCVFVGPSPNSVSPAGEGTVFATYQTTFEVEGEAPAVFDVTASTSAGPAGTPVTLTGINCQPGLGTTVAVAFMPAGPTPDFDPTDDSLQTYPVTDGHASGSFVIPAGTPAGTYQFVAWCLGEGGQPLEGTDAQVLPFTVTAAAVPVGADPDFTG